LRKLTQSKLNFFLSTINKKRFKGEFQKTIFGANFFFWKGLNYNFWYDLEYEIKKIKKSHIWETHSYTFIWEIFFLIVGIPDIFSNISFQNDKNHYSIMNIFQLNIFLSFLMLKKLEKHHFLTNLYSSKFKNWIQYNDDFLPVSLFATAIYEENCLQRYCNVGHNHVYNFL
jgi:hypothetical protein